MPLDLVTFCPECGRANHSAVTNCDTPAYALLYSIQLAMAVRGEELCVGAGWGGQAGQDTVRELGYSRGSGDQVARVGLVHKTKTLPTSLTSGITPPTHSGTGMQEEIPLQ